MAQNNSFEPQPANPVIDTGKISSQTPNSPDSQKLVGTVVKGTSEPVLNCMGQIAELKLSPSPIIDSVTVTQALENLQKNQGQGK